LARGRKGGSKRVRAGVHGVDREQFWGGNEFEAVNPCGFRPRHGTVGGNF
jgi:hypothetical protein